MRKQRDIGDGRLLELLLGRAHAANVDEEAECVGFFVLVPGMCVVENHELAAVAVGLLESGQH